MNPVCRIAQNAGPGTGDLTHPEPCHRRAWNKLRSLAGGQIENLEASYAPVGACAEIDIGDIVAGEEDLLSIG